MIKRAVAAAIAAAAASAGAIAFGWVPDWVWPLLPYWPWAVIIVGAGIAWRFAGTPGLTIFAGVVGFIAGRRSRDDDFVGDVTGHDAAPSPPTPRRKQSVPARQTIVDAIKRMRKK